MNITRNELLNMKNYLKKNPIDGIQIVDDEFILYPHPLRVGQFRFYWPERDKRFRIDVVDGIFPGTSLFGVFLYEEYGDITVEDVDELIDKYRRYLPDETYCAFENENDAINLFMFNLEDNCSKMEMKSMLTVLFNISKDLLDKHNSDEAIA